ncbi:MAG: aspartate aminotransferase family protein [Actinobacteria bacterium]|nr:aspartate aminotransferase family protein [Actinomycetota bacterium]
MSSPDTSHEARAVIPRDFSADYPMAVSGDGVRIRDREGREYIDADSGAISVISVGHGVDEVVEAIAEQARRLAFVHNGQFENEPAEELARALADFAPGGLNRSTFVSGGSEGVETALKLARQYQVLRGRPEKEIVISRERSYHGATLIALGLSGVPSRQEPYRPYFSPLTPKVHAPYAYRTIAGDDAGSPDELEAAILAAGPDRVAAFIAEPIGAAAAPGITPGPDYYREVRAICDRHDVLFIADEVVTGMGRTGRNFGIEHWDVEPDVIVTAKGLAGGYVPLGAVIAQDEIVELFEAEGASFVHGLTYESHPVACAAGVAVLAIIVRDRLVENAARQGDRLFSGLARLAEEHPVMGDIRGKGLLAGIEFVADLETKRPFDPGIGFAARIRAAAQEHGVMIYQGAAPYGGAGDQILISPPLTVTGADVDEIVAGLDLALGDVRAQLAKELP